MVKLTKSGAHGIFLTTPETSMQGVAFLPLVDIDDAETDLTTALARAGYFACWTGGALPPTGLVTLAGALKSARDGGAGASRDYIQFFRSDADGPELVLKKSGDFTDAATVRPTDGVYGDVPGVHRLVLTQAEVELSGAVLRLKPADGDENHLLKQASDFPIKELGLSLTGETAGCFVGQITVSRKRLSRNGFLSALARRGAEILDEDTGEHIGYEIDDDSRQILVDSLAPGARGITFDIVYDALSAINRERTYFGLPEEQPLLSALGSTDGHDVVLRPRVCTETVDAPGRLPQFSFVRRRTEEDIGGNFQSDNISLVLEGDFEVVDQSRQAGAVDEDEEPSGDPGIVIGDSPHEFLLPPESGSSPTDADEPVVLSLRRGPGYLEPFDPAQNRENIFGLKAEGDDGSADQMVYGALSRAGKKGAVVSEARNVRRLGKTQAGAVDEDSADTLSSDPFRLRRKESLKGVPGGMVPILPRRNAMAIRATDAVDDDVGDFVDDTPLDDEERSDGKLSLADALIKERRKILTAAPEIVPGEAPDTEEVTDSDNAVYSRTPLGFKIKQSMTGVVTEIILAETPKAGSVETAQLRVLPGDGQSAIDSSFLNALVRNQLFMVANRSGEEVQKFKLNGRLELSNWGFDIDLWGSWNPSGGVAPIVPLVIIKGFEGKSIVDLIKEPDLWSARNYLQSRDGSDPVAYARSMFDDAVTEAKKVDEKTGQPAPAFRKFREIIHDKTWNGVLVLNIRIPPDTLPAEIKGLLSGIKMDEFQAHHLGIPVRRIAGGNPLSKAFAAINYAPENTDEISYDSDLDPGTIPGQKQAENGADGDKRLERFAMRVKLLRVGFNSGKIQNFECKIDLKIGSFFHAKFGPDDAVQYKVIELEGRFVRRDGKETYDFRTDTDFLIELPASFPLVNSVLIDRVIYASTVSKAADGTERVDSGFDISGWITFKPQEGVDFFGLEKISFTNLSIDMRFRLPDPGEFKIGWPKFRFSPGGLLVDFDKVVGEGNRNFWSSLPLKFTGFGWLGDVLTLPKLGFFSLGKGGGGGNGAPFFLNFDLDLGSLGGFASKLADFKMELGLVFGLDKDDNPKWDLGFRFNGSGGTGLEIGLEGFLKLKCDRYALVQMKHERDGEEPFTYYAFKGLNARLIIFGNQIPPQDKDNPDQTASIYIFVNPDKLGQGEGVGWLLATKDIFRSSVLDVTTLALGQRVNPFELSQTTRIQTRDVLAKFDNLATGLPNDSSTDTVPVFPDDITFAPDYGWSIGFKSIFYDLVHIGFATVDPVLAGILLDVKLSKGDDDSLFAIDVLYRKLSDDLGVYAIEVVLPPYLRNWQFGAVGITIPAIGIEIFTDGNWGIDIGYPRNKDFQRSFAVNVFPFVGAGGFYYRRVAGPAARLVPRAALGTDGTTVIPYNPVTEVGFGMRVGLGVTVAQGILNAGLSVTVYGYLEGAYAKLNFSDGLVPTHAKRSYISVWGAVGVMGELYGYVDFGIVKAGVFVQLYIEVGLRLETDRATELYIEAGVRVRVRVVIGSFKVFGKRIEIAVCFSFATTVRFSRFIGTNRNQQYYLRNSPALDGLDEDLAAVSLRDNLDWSNAPSPVHWGLGDAVVPMSVTLQPDLTMAPDPSGTGEVHAVYLMAAKLSADGDPSPVERLVQGLTAWALCAGLEVEPDELSSLGVGAEELQIVAEKLATPGRSGPRYTEIVDFLSVYFPATAETLQENPDTDDKNVPRAALLPLPEALSFVQEIKTVNDEGEEVRTEIRRTLNESVFVDAAYRSRLELAIARFVHLQRSAKVPATDDDTAESLARILTEEWVEMIMRAGTAELVDRLTDGLGDEGPDPVMIASDLVASLLERPRAAEEAEETDDDAQPLRSAAEDIVVTAGRFFAYGQRLPEPSDTANVPAGQETRPDNDLRDYDAQEEIFFHAMHRLTGNQFALADAISLSIPAATYDGWLTVPTGNETGGIDRNEINSFRDAALNWSASADWPEISTGNFSRERIRRVSLGTPAMAAVLDAAVPDLDGKTKLWLLSPEAQTVLENRKDDAAEPDIAIALPKSGKARTFDTDATGFHPAIVIDVALRRPGAMQKDDGGTVPDQANVKDAFEILGIPEPLRRLLNPFAPVKDGGEETPPTIARIGLYKPAADRFTALNDTEGATIVQSNLSIEVAPGEAELDDDSEERIAPVADRITDKIGFLRLLRQAAIVNTGGYTLSYPQADDDLAELVDAGGEGNPLNAGGRIRVVVALADAVAGLKYANALLNDDMLGLPTTAPDNAVVAIAAGVTREPLHDPGVIPVRVMRPVPDKGSADWQIQERFSNLALDVRVLDSAGNAIGTPQYGDQAIATGPDFDDENVSDDNRVYRVSIPAAGIAYAGQTNPNAYDLVGGKVVVSGAWRDIYGNAWPRGLDEKTFDVVYSDRLVGLANLPHLKMAYWPADDGKILVSLESRYDGLAVLDGDENANGDLPIPEVWLRQKLRELERDIALLNRARLQILDGRVTAEITSPLGSQALGRETVGDHLKASVLALESLVKVYARALPADAGGAGIPRKDLETAIKAKVEAPKNSVPALWQFTKIDLDASGAAANPYTEFELALNIRRPLPAADDGLYSNEVTDPETGGEFEELWRLTQAIPPNVTGESAEDTPDELKGFGGTSDALLAALATCTPSHRIALGYGAEPGILERGIWLVRKDYLDKITSQGRYDTVKPVAFSFPPLKNAPFTSDLELRQRGAAESVKKRVVDADADAFGRTAMERIESLLSPAVAVPLLNKASANAADRVRMRAAIDRLLNLKNEFSGVLARRLTEVFAVEMPETKSGERRRRLTNLVTDRLRRDLRSHYSTTSVLAYFTEDDLGVHAKIPVANAKIIQSPDVDDDVVMKAFNVPLEAAAGPVSNDLFVACEVPPGTGKPSFPLPTHLELTHVQRKERPDTGSGAIGYRDTAWLELFVPDPEADPWTRVELKERSRFVPNVLRALPRPPRIEEEWFEAAPATGESPISIRRARQWTSLREVRWEAGATDRLYADLRYKTFDAVDALDESSDLPSLIATFVLETDPVMPAILDAADIDAFVWAAERASAMLGIVTPEFDALDSADLLDEAVFREEGDEVVAEKVVLATPGGETEPENADGIGEFEPRSLTYGIRGKDSVSFVEEGGPFRVPGHDPDEKFPLRVIGARGLDILTHASASTEIRQTRNEKIRGKALKPSFIYELPRIGSGEPTVPMIDRTEAVSAGELVFTDGKLELGGADGTSSREQTLKRTLYEFLKLLLGEVTAQPTATTWTDLVFEYESGLFVAEEGGPVILVMSNVDWLDKDALNSQIDTMAESLKKWLEKRPAYTPEGVPRGKLLVDARIYVRGDAGDTERLVMRLRRCEFTFSAG
ncbi:hypothetical protein [Roseibium alexandrii]|uniref:LysM domain-containing protein n=1 Tax=Roseibium alexandrii TaxID=388408 RepID=A0A0M7AEZ5_9HYPH|nr:hypothetical protein [Roseibium alexandrii]CTQ72770.1 hypothetical protein LAX5112_03292 [Roseibium alexandrii]